MGKKNKKPTTTSSNKKSPDKIRTILSNKKARFQYEIVEKYETGIELKGTEVKSIKLGKVSINEAYARFKGDELFIVGMHIKPYEQGNIFNHDPIRNRKLLMHRLELDKLQAKVMEKGFTLVPLSIYIKKALVKVSIGLCKGKKIYDKRENIKEREVSRDLDRTMKEYKNFKE